MPRVRTIRHANVLDHAESDERLALAPRRVRGATTPKSMPNQTPSNEEAGRGCSSSALFGVAVWNPLEHGIQGQPLMVPAHDYNRVASSLAEALSLALQYVPLTGDDAEKIRELERAATIPPNAEGETRRPSAPHSGPA